MIIDPEGLDRRTVSALLGGLVYPRPIALVSTVDSEGLRNLAPFSFFNAFSFFPPTIGISPGSRDGVNKDSLRNIRETGEFVVNVVNERLARLANLCSAEFDGSVDEWEVSGLDSEPSEAVTPRRLSASPAALECRAMEFVDLGTAERPTNTLIVARVERIHVADAALNGLEPDDTALGLVGRMGGDLWCRTGDTFELPRPSHVDEEELAREAAALRSQLARDMNNG